MISSDVYRPYIKMYEEFACVQQLQLLQKVLEAERVIAMAMNFVGDQKELEATLADVQVGRYTGQDTGAKLEVPSRAAVTWLNFISYVMI